MKISKKEKIIESFQKMDLGMLDVLLDDYKTYQDATKKVFLEKVNMAFSKLKENGDTLLLSHTGFCNSYECPNKGCTGYSFIGNKSKKHIDLIFEEIGDDVKDIYNCNGFEINDKSVKKENPIRIFIQHDEKADFNPGADFLIISQKCKSAYEELIQYQNTVIDKFVYLVWLQRFYDLYKSFEMPPLFYSDLNNFHSLYFSIHELYEFLQENEFAIEAIEEFKTIDKSNESQLLKWLVKYENTGLNLRHFSYKDIDFQHPEKHEYFEVTNLKISTSDFKHIASFKFLFDEYYWDSLEKFTTFSIDERIQHINENSEMSILVNSLSYHLSKRGIEL